MRGIHDPISQSLSLQDDVAWAGGAGGHQLEPGARCVLFPMGSKGPGTASRLASLPSAALPPRSSCLSTGHHGSNPSSPAGTSRFASSPFYPPPSASVGEMPDPPVMEVASATKLAEVKIEEASQIDAGAVQGNGDDGTLRHPAAATNERDEVQCPAEGGVNGDGPEALEQQQHALLSSFFHAQTAAAAAVAMAHEVATGLS